MHGGHTSKPKQRVGATRQAEAAAAHTSSETVAIAQHVEGVAAGAVLVEAEASLSQRQSGGQTDRQTEWRHIKSYLEAGRHHRIPAAVQNERFPEQRAHLLDHARVVDCGKTSSSTRKRTHAARPAQSPAHGPRPTSEGGRLWAQSNPPKRWRF